MIDLFAIGQRVAEELSQRTPKPAPQMNRNESARPPSDSKKNSANPPYPQRLYETTANLRTAADLNLPLLAEDSRFIDTLLGFRSDHERNAVLREYQQRWRTYADAEPLEHRKENAGRFAANSWLRSKLH